MRALIVDDERLARNELRRLLGHHPEIDVVGEAANAPQARKALEDLEPDLLFLDVQMPGETGFDLLASLDCVPLVVFTTAYDEHALRAFEVNALDYLVKPIDPRRLASTVSRLLSRVPPRVGERVDADGSCPGASLEAAAGARSRLLSERDRVFVSEGERCWLIELGEIQLFEAVGNATRVFFGKERPLINRPLNHLEKRMDGRLFIRANRHQIVNVKAIHGIRPWFGGRLLVEIAGGKEVTFSRRRARAFREQMSM
jgi:two-component system LytT family response regulator